MKRTLGMSLAALLLLTACGPDDGPEEDADAGDRESTSDAGADTRVTAKDDSLSLELPEGWEEIDRELPGAVVLAATEAGDETQQIIVSRYDGAEAAENEAIFSATGISEQGGVCERLDDDTTYGEPRLVFDCAFTEPEVFRKVLVPVAGEDESAVVLVQLTVTSLDETASVVTPILESIEWE